MRDLDLDMIAAEIGDNLSRYGRIHVSQTKEKYGEIRVYCSFGHYNLYGVVWPQHNFYEKGWRWMARIKIPSLVNYLTVPYQQWVYSRVYAAALAKYPEARYPILAGADWSELLEKYEN